MVEGIAKAGIEKRDRFGDAGVAAALARFRSMGELSRKTEQHGRARDKRLRVSEVEDKNRGERPILLNYTDETGREVTPKEAFRLMCHKFHGKGPSKNKREARLRRELRQLKMKQMESDDTPLGSAAALREETRKTGSAHVVLSGPSVTLDNSLENDRGLSKDT